MRLCDVRERSLAVIENATETLVAVKDGGEECPFLHAWLEPSFLAPVSYEPEVDPELTCQLSPAGQQSRDQCSGCKPAWGGCRGPANRTTRAVRISLFIPRHGRPTANGGGSTAGGHVEPYVGRGQAMIHVLGIRRAAPVSVHGGAPSHNLLATPVIWAFIVAH